MPKLVKRYLFQLLLSLILLGISGYLFVDRIGGLFQTPFQSSIRGWDDSFYYFWLRSFFVDGDFDFSNEIYYCDTLDEDARQQALSMPLTEKGYLPNKYPIGWALSSAPWYLFGDLVTRIVNFFGGKLLTDGYGPFYQLMIMSGQWIYAWLSLFFIYKISCQFLDKDNAFFAVAIIWSGSALFYYQNIQLSMAHNLSFFAITGCYWVTLLIKENTKSLFLWIVLAVLSALVILSRLQGIVYLLYPAVVLWALFYKDRKLYPYLIVFIFMGIIALLPQLFVWKILYGQYLPYTYQGEGFNWLTPDFTGVLFSPFHGWFYWTPIIFISLIGFASWTWRVKNMEAATWSIALLITVYLNASWHDSAFGASFGARAFEGATLFAIIGLGEMFRLTGIRKRLKYISIIIGLLFSIWNINLILLVRFWKYSGITLTQNVTYKDIVNSSYKFWFDKD